MWPLEHLKILNFHYMGNFPGGPVAKASSSQCRGPGSIPDQGTRFHMLQLKILHATKTEDPQAATKTRNRQMNKLIH